MLHVDLIETARVYLPGLSGLMTLPDVAERVGVDWNGYWGDYSGKYAQR